MHVTRQLAISPETMAQYWRLYDEAFTPLSVVSPHRQNLYEEEFYAELADERVIKFVLWDGGQSIGLALVATDVTAMTWVSPAYFAHHFPEHFAERRIFYVGVLFVAERHQHAQLAKVLMAEVSNYVISNDGIAAFDCASVNNDIVPRLSAASMHRQTLTLETRKLDHQHYYALVPSGFRPGFGPGRHAELERDGR